MIGVGFIDVIWCADSVIGSIIAGVLIVGITVDLIDLMMGVKKYIRKRRERRKHEKRHD